MAKHATKEELDRAFDKGERDGKSGESVDNPYVGMTERTTEINEAYRAGHRKGRKDD